VLSLSIALRYLFSRTRLHAVNYVTALSAIAIAVVAMALVAVVGVYNGYVAMILDATAQVDADIVLKDAAGAVFDLHDLPDYRRQLTQAGAEAITLRLESKGLLHVGEQQWVVDAIGVDSTFAAVYPMARAAEVPTLHTATTFTDGEGIPITPIQIGASIQLPPDSSRREQAGATAEVLFPKRLGFTNPLAPASSFQSIEAQVIGQYAPVSQEMDAAVYLPLSRLQEALDYGASQVSSIGIHLRQGISTSDFKRQVQELYGDKLKALDREEQHPDLSYLIRMEKVMTYLILLFILLLAAFNVASSLAMLLIEKEEDSRIFTALGAPPRFTQQVFRRVGLLIALTGTSIGMLLGWGLCLLQAQFGLVRSGSGMDAIALPVDVRPLDMLVIFISVTALSFLISLYPTRFFRRG
jgi:putative membrane protein